ncbi:UNVERIFIED_CONTAM: hypothetical protein Sangu_2745100 [Sesamum angustifolium]|uniref:Uncharacterized protein n=1 Tax=Sesamum angustifolium TaxID=2727405 RepID=A0AAW2IVW4_9LAMI
MVTDEQALGDGWIRSRSRRNGIGGRRRWAGTELAATPFVQWKLRGGDSAAQSAVSVRKLAASLWRVSATNSDGGSVRWQCGLLIGSDLSASYVSCLLVIVPTPKIATEGVTKWDYCYSKAWVDVSYFRGRAEILKNNQEIATTPVASARCAELFKARKRINKLEAEQGNSSRILKKEKRARELWEDVCDELAKEIEGSKAEIEALRNQHTRFQEEVEKERKMMQLVEVWREERSQMKLINAKLMSENKYTKMNNLIVDLEAFLRPLKSTADMVKEFSSEIEDSQTCEAEKARWFKWLNWVVVLRGETSCQETLTQAEIYPSRTSGGSDHSVNKISRRKYTSNYDAEHKENAHHGYERSESNEISSVSLKQSKKKKSSTISKLHRTLPRNEDTCKTILTDGISQRPSNQIGLAAGQGVCGERAVAGQDLVGQWRSPDQRRNPHIVRAMKGHIEWRRGIPRQGSAANLLKAKLESQKMILRNVLKKRS